MRGVEIADETGAYRIESADAYVLALGSFSPMLARPLGVKLDIYPAKGYSATLPVLDATRAPSVSLTDDEYKLVFSRFGDRLRIAGTAELSGYAMDLNPVRCEAIVRRTLEVFPGMSRPELAQFWTGLRPATPGNVPYIGASAVRGLYLNTGHGTLGWTHGCGSGRAIADIVSGRVPEVDFAFTGELPAGAPRPAGVLRMHSFASVGHHYVMPALTRYHTQFPDVSIELSLSQRMPDLFDGTSDMAVVTASSLPDSELVSHLLGSTFSILCASPGYVKRHGAPCTTSVTIASARTVRAPTPGTCSSSVKSFGPFSAAAARLPCSRRVTTSLARTSWWSGSIRCGSRPSCSGASARRRSPSSRASSRTMRSGPSVCSSSSCASREARARRSARLMMRPWPGPSTAACGSSRKLCRPSDSQW